MKFIVVIENIGKELKKINKMGYKTNENNILIKIHSEKKMEIMMKIVYLYFNSKNLGEEEENTE